MAPSPASLSLLTCLMFLCSTYYFMTLYLVSILHSFFPHQSRSPGRGGRVFGLHGAVPQSRELGQHSSQRGG